MRQRRVHMAMHYAIMVALAAATMFLPAAGLADGSASSPRAFVQQLTDESLGIIDRRDAGQAGRTFAQNLDMPAFAQRCLADHWATLTEEQRAEFIDLFSRTLRAKMDEALSKRVTGKAVRFAIGSPKRPDKEGIIEVPADIFIDGNSVRLTYYLIKWAGGYRLVDYDAEGALLSRNYRGQFNYLIRNYGYAGMIERIRQKAEAQAARSQISHS